MEVRAVIPSAKEIQPPVPLLASIIWRVCGTGPQGSAVLPSNEQTPSSSLPGCYVSPPQGRD